MGNADNMSHWGQELRRFDLRELSDEMENEDDKLHSNCEKEALPVELFPEACSTCIEGLQDESLPRATNASASSSSSHAPVKLIYRPSAFHWYYKSRGAIDIHNHLRLGKSYE
jgi:hypothetical protein